MHDPIQHAFETQAFQVVCQTVALAGGQVSLLEPHPQVAKDQGNRNTVRQDELVRHVVTTLEESFLNPSMIEQQRAEIVAEKRELREWQSQHHWSPNQLRHTAATEIRKRHGLEAAQVILGHSQLGVTQVYAERDIAKGTEVARLIG